MNDDNDEKGLEEEEEENDDEDSRNSVSLCRRSLFRCFRSRALRSDREVRVVVVVVLGLGDWLLPLERLLLT